MARKTKPVAVEAAETPRKVTAPAPIMVPAPRPGLPAGISAAELDAALAEVTLTSPVTWQDCAELRELAAGVYSGARAECYSHDRRTVHLCVWWANYHTGPAIRRTLHT